MSGIEVRTIARRGDLVCTLTNMDKQHQMVAPCHAMADKIYTDLILLVVGLGTHGATRWLAKAAVDGGRPLAR